MNCPVARAHGLRCVWLRRPWARATAAGRGLTGHSMGGYGAVRIGMKASGGVFQYLCPEPRDMAGTEAIHTPEDVAKADFGTKNPPL